MSTNTGVLSRNTRQYRRRKPQYTPYYQCIEDYYEEFKRTYDRRFSQKYGYLRSHIEKVIYQYLDCGILHNGFARVRCGSYKHEYLLAFSCKRRHFCPVCLDKMKIIAFIEDYKVVRKILDYLGICEFDKKRAPPKAAEDPAEFDDYIIDDYIDSDHVC
jgi:hypothetical protein